MPLGDPPVATGLAMAMTGKASAAKAAEGDAPVLAYIAGLPRPQRDLAERVDALAARTRPSLERAIKRGMAYYGVDGGWCFSSAAFVGHLNVMFIRGAEIEPEPPVTPIGMGKSTRGRGAGVGGRSRRAAVAVMDEAGGGDAVLWGKCEEAGEGVRGEWLPAIRAVF